MDIKLVHPFEEVNVTVDCGGFRVDSPKVNIAILNGEIDAKKSLISIAGTYHLHPFQAVKALKETPSDDPDGDNMAVGLVSGVFDAAAKVSAASGQEADAMKFREFAADRTFCLATCKIIMEESKL